MILRRAAKETLRGRKASFHHRRSTFFKNPSYENGKALTLCRSILETYSRCPSQKSTLYNTLCESPSARTFVHFFDIKRFNRRRQPFFIQFDCYQTFALVHRNVRNTPEVYTQTNNKNPLQKLCSLALGRKPQKSNLQKSIQPKIAHMIVK